MRKQTEQIVANALEQFRQHLDQAAAMEETAFDQRVEKGFADLEAALTTFREDLEDELTARREQAVAAAEQMLRARFAAMAAATRAPGTGVPASSPTDAATKKK
jgi:F0F1-type ATP synthase membrane subunit b/b'